MNSEVLHVVLQYQETFTVRINQSFPLALKAKKVLKLEIIKSGRNLALSGKSKLNLVIPFQILSSCSKMWYQREDVRLHFLFWRGALRFGVKSEGLRDAQLPHWRQSKPSTFSQMSLLQLHLPFLCSNLWFLRKAPRNYTSSNQSTMG